MIWVIGNDNDTGHLSWRGTCPLLKHTCVSLRVGDEKKEWEGKEKQSLQEETSDNIQRMQLT